MEIRISTSGNLETKTMHYQIEGQGHLLRHIDLDTNMKLRVLQD